MVNNKSNKYFDKKTITLLLIWVITFVVFILIDSFLNIPKLHAGFSILKLVGIIAGIFVFASILTFITQFVVLQQHKPTVESMMISRLYWFVAILVVILVSAYSIGKPSTFGTFLTLFGGMFLGWSLQAPVSGFAAWILVSLKRPIRPGDRIQFPNLGLTGDVQEIGAMYTILNQVGGTVGSEEAVGRHILVPNAMLFSQVVINYTVTQEAAYMLDEVVVRITFDSNWDVAEKILLTAAIEVTKDVIETTGQKPYIRSDLYDYGVYLRLRYQTHVKERVEIQYKIAKKIFEEIQKNPAVDIAIPFIYSYRAAADKKEDEHIDKELKQIRAIGIDKIRTDQTIGDESEVNCLIQSITSRGLLQPIIVMQNPKDGLYDILAGHLRYEACKRLGWKTIAAIIKNNSIGPNHN